MSSEEKQGLLSLNATSFIVVVLVVVLAFGAGYLWSKVKYLEEKNSSSSTQDTSESVQGTSNKGDTTTSGVTADGKEGSFSYSNSEEICKKDGKPIVYLFSTTTCPHCTWVKDTFDATMKEYVDQGKIVAYHWELDTGNDTLTSATESETDSTAMAAYQKFNPDGYVPSYVFGCKYWRIGNAHESANDLQAEAAEFKTIIDKLIQ